MSVSASILTLALVIIRAVFKKAPKSYICFLWSFVAVRLLCPYSPQSKLSVIPERVSDVAKTATIESDYVAVAATSQNSGGLHFNDLLPDILTAVWIAGIIIMLLYSITSYIKLRKKLVASQNTSGIIWICDYISSPFIFGIFSPKIYLPSSLDAEKSKCVVAHEMSHLARRDNIWKPLGFVILSVYWFNPVMWLSYILFCRDIEFACDERVIKKTEQSERKFCSIALLECSSKRMAFSACPLAFGETGVKERIIKIINYTKPKTVVKIAAGMLSIVIAVCFMTNLVANAAENESSDINQSRKEVNVEVTTEVTGTTEAVTEEAVTEASTEPNTESTTSIKNKNTYSYDFADSQNDVSDVPEASYDEAYRDANVFENDNKEEADGMDGILHRVTGAPTYTEPKTTSIYGSNNYDNSVVNHNTTEQSGYSYPIVPNLFF